MVAQQGDRQVIVIAGDRVYGPFDYYGMAEDWAGEWLDLSKVMLMTLTEPYEEGISKWRWGLGMPDQQYIRQREDVDDIWFDAIEDHYRRRTA